MSTGLLLARLTSRRILRITGPDCYPYLQGLLSNDVRLLYEDARIIRRKCASNSRNVISSFMINAQGRVICDLLLYRTPRTRDSCEFTPPGQAKENDELLIECDSSLSTGLARTLWGYRVRRNINVELEENLSPWCLYRASPQVLNKEEDLSKTPLQLAGKSSEFVIKEEDINDEFTVVNDPRISAMGLRILSQASSFENLKKALSSKTEYSIANGSAKQYLTHRYMLGIGEGIKDHPESNCLPLECNADFTSSVSFTKGCYMGQELTTRIYHTGVIRKRLMPIILAEGIKPNLENFPDGADIEDGSGIKVGTLRYFYNSTGLALMRTKVIDENLDIFTSKIKLRTHVPHWWGDRIN